MRVHDLPPELSDATPGAALRARVARRPEDLASAALLVQRRYQWRGYQLTNHADGDASSPLERITLLAERGGRLLGTLTVGIDALHGLLAEKTYGAEIARLRDKGHRLGELTRLAMEAYAESKGVLDALVHAAWTVTRVLDTLTAAVIEVNPRHVRFYERIFGFDRTGPARVCSRVGAPSVLLTLDLERFAERLAGRARGS